MNSHDSQKSKDLEWHRREFVKNILIGGPALGLLYNKFNDIARADGPNSDEHFFVFVELKGGVQWIVGTDGRDLKELKAADPEGKKFFSLDITTPNAAKSSAAAIFAANQKNEEVMSMNGQFIILPYINHLEDCYQSGKTNLGADYTLGFAARALKDVVSDIAHVRGVRMLGTFHGSANNEIFSGAPSGASHAAGVLAKQLSATRTPRLLDNLVFENAAFAKGTMGDFASPIAIDAQSFAALINGSDASSSDEAKAKAAMQIASTYAKAPGLSPEHRGTFASYVGSMQQLDQVRRLLMPLKGSLQEVDASLDLNLQFKLAMTILQSGLARVLTLCLGSSNGKNKVDGFGLFDCHTGQYQRSPDDNRANSEMHHESLRQAMNALADFIKTLKATPYGSGKTMWDMTTVVVSSEFGRTSNLNGGEGGFVASFGSGHNYYNNSYLLFGKGVKGGAWLGKNELVSQVGYSVDFDKFADSSLEANSPKSISYIAPDFHSETYGLELTGQKRPIMARDLVKTILNIGGVGASKFHNLYVQSSFADAKLLHHVVKNPLT